MAEQFNHITDYLKKHQFQKNLITFTDLNNFSSIEKKYFVNVRRAFFRITGKDRGSFFGTISGQF